VNDQISRPTAMSQIEGKPMGADVLLSTVSIKLELSVSVFIPGS
jgi:hypothetical protein